jgi:hypothetical protein
VLVVCVLLLFLLRVGRASRACVCCELCAPTSVVRVSGSVSNIVCENKYPTRLF